MWCPSRRTRMMSLTLLREHDDQNLFVPFVFRSSSLLVDVSKREHGII